MNPKLFGAIVVVGSTLSGCRTGTFDPPDLAAPVADLGVIVDQARTDQAKVDLANVDAGADLQPCCTFGSGEDLSGCIPITCILI